MTDNASLLEFHHRPLHPHPTQRDQHQAISRHQDPGTTTRFQGRCPGSQHPKRSTTGIQGRAHSSPHLKEPYSSYQKVAGRKGQSSRQAVRPPQYERALYPELPTNQPSNSKAPSNASSSIAECARDMLAKNSNADAGMQDLYRQLMRTSVKSPAVMVCTPKSLQANDHC